MRVETDQTLTRFRRSWPWCTSALAACAVGMWGWDRTPERLFFDRELIAEGQLWRLLSGHFAHHSTSHMMWNLAVFLPAGLWLETIAPRVTRGFLLLVPFFISAALWWLSPQLDFYAGLSGVTVGVVTLLALVQLRAGSPEPRGIWVAALGLIAAKITFESMRPETSLFAGLPDGVRNVPLAHVAGAIGAVIAATMARLGNLTRT